jgi:hypothetical protein
MFLSQYVLQPNLSNPRHQWTREMCRIVQDVRKLRCRIVQDVRKLRCRIVKQDVRKRRCRIVKQDVRKLRCRIACLFIWQLINFISVELFGSMSNFGISLGFPAGMLCERFGPRWTSLVGLIVSTSGYMLLWSTTLMRHFYSTKAALQAVYFFVAGKFTHILARTVYACEKVCMLIHICICTTIPQQCYCQSCV